MSQGISQYGENPHTSGVRVLGGSHVKVQETHKRQSFSFPGFKRPCVQIGGVSSKENRKGQAGQKHHVNLGQASMRLA